jgi:nicotinamide riboside transporter PnuC
MDKEWVECWVLTVICVVIAIVAWVGGDAEMAGYATAGAILLPSFKWYYSKN